MAEKLSFDDCVNRFHEIVGDEAVRERMDIETDEDDLAGHIAERAINDWNADDAKVIGDVVASSPVG